VARRVGDDERAPVGREVAIGDVDRDALLAFGGEAVEEQREVELAALRADAPRLRVERLDLIVEQRAALVEETSDERALAVVDVAARDEPEQALVLSLLEIPEQVGVGGCAQKYPSFFFFSIDASPSRSIRRPCRSDDELRSISRISSGTLCASLGTAPESG
jgi:hypothetical protein